MPSDVERKSRTKRRDKNKSLQLPSQVVCTAQDALVTKGSIELGVVFCLVVIGLYLYGFCESIQALPDVATGRILGGNLNLAKLQRDEVLLSTSGSDHIAVAAAEETLTVGGVKIPVGKWPVSTRDEEDDFEILIHTGDHKTEMRVPKFWAPPVHNKQQFTREQASKIGTCLSPDPVTGSHVRGTDCPVDDRTIFIAIASYRDYQCRYTVESAFLRAKNPHRIRIGEFCYIEEIVARQTSGGVQTFSYA